MKKHSCIVWCVSFLLKAALSKGHYCAGVDNSSVVLQFCNTNNFTGSFVYLETSGIPVGDIGECACTLSSVSGTLVNVNIAAIPNSKTGQFELIVDGNPVHTPVNVSYRSEMDIVLQKYASEHVYQCLYVTGEYADRSVSHMLHAACSVRREITSEPQHSTETSTTTRPNNTTYPTVAQSETPTRTRPITTPDPSVAPGSTSSPKPGEKIEGDDTSGPGGSNIGIIAGAVAGGLAVIVIIVVVVIIMFRRTRKAGNEKDEPHDYSDTGKDPEYAMTINEGYMSADDVDNQRNAQRPMETYKDIADTDATSKTFSTTDHGASDYAVVNKSRSKKTNQRYDLDEDTEYNSLTDKIVNRPTGNIYGVALPIQPKYSAE